MWNVKSWNECSILNFIIVLIETLWNVKYRLRCSNMFQATGINRNIVECKVVTLLSIFYHRSVLIETLWNVKIWESQGYSVTRLVLIETLWNVKFLRSDTMSITNVGINRNIVECKDAYSGVNWCGCLPRINRNIVECKDTLIITPLKTYDPY